MLAKRQRSIQDLLQDPIYGNSTVCSTLGSCSYLFAYGLPEPEVLPCWIIPMLGLAQTWELGSSSSDENISVSPIYRDCRIVLASRGDRSSTLSLSARSKTRFS